jgi:hypothetical protein
LLPVAGLRVCRAPPPAGRGRSFCAAAQVAELQARVAQLEKENEQLRKNFSVGTTKTSPSGDTVHIIEEVVRYHGRNSANVLPGWVGYMTDGQIEQVFDEIDVDKTGKLTVSELQASLAAKGLLLSDEAAQAVMQECDQDGSGSLSKTEFLDVVKRIK